MASQPRLGTTSTPPSQAMPHEYNTYAEHESHVPAQHKHESHVPARWKHESHVPARYKHESHVPARHKYGTAVHVSQLCRRRFIAKICRGGLTVVLVLTILVNISLIIENSRRIQQVQGAIQDPENAAELHIERRSIKQVTEPPRTIDLEVYSSRHRVYMGVDGAMIYEDREKDEHRGVHVVVLSQATGSIMAEQHFDTYIPKEDEAMTLFLSMLAPGRLLLIAVKDEASSQLKKPARDWLSRLGSAHVQNLAWRDTWALAAVKKDNGCFAEVVNKTTSSTNWGKPVLLKTAFTLRPTKEAECDWPESEVNKRRKHFCQRFEGYGSVCSCTRPAPLTFHTLPIADDLTSDIPVIIIASNRPRYLYRMLRSLLAAQGVNPAMITVFIDGYYEGPLEVARLFGLNAVQHTPLGEKAARISQHYRASITATFNLFPKAQYAIIFEEDLDVSPDIFSYFSQTLPVLEADDSLYCVSAWNDQGYEHSSADPALLYRVETMPGLGWVLKRSLFKEELEAAWPTSEKQWDWDMWLRMPEVRNGRECIVPDISRTYHFGTRGVNMNSYFQDVYFKKHTLNTLPHVKLKDPFSLTKERYEEVIKTLIRRGELLDHSADPCADNFIPATITNHTYLLFITMQHSTDYSTWKLLAHCWGLWDLDVRGVHRGTWRLFLHGNHVLVIGSPASPYAIYKPAETEVVTLTDAIQET